MGHRYPGPQGIARRVLDKIDIGTLVRAASPVPGVVSVDALSKQMSSWTRPIRDLPRSAEEMTAKLGEIYFRTDEHELDANDRMALSKLCDNLKSLFKVGYRFDLKCWGNADHRKEDDYNLKLGDRRAEAVKNYLIDNVPDSRLQVAAESLGETKARQPGGVWKRVPPVLMASERRVDIAVENVVPPVRIGITGDFGWATALDEVEVKRLELTGKPRDIGWFGLRDCFDERVTVLIKVDYHVTKTDKEWTADVACTVTDLLKRKRLFEAVAGIDTKRFITQEGYRTLIKPKRDNCPPEYSRVIRIIFPGGPKRPEPPGDARRVEEAVLRLEVDDFFDLLPDIYPKLTGKYANITERVKEAMKPAEAAK